MLCPASAIEELFRAATLSKSVRTKMVLTAIGRGICRTLKPESLRKLRRKGYVSYVPRKRSESGVAIGGYWTI
jgi:hypothetical protein